MLDYAGEGAKLVFGPLGDPPVWREVLTKTLGSEAAGAGVIFAFRVLPTIIFVAALFAVLYYLGVMQLVVRLFAVVMRRFMRASGAESLNVAASIFMGQTEAPLTIRPYLPQMTQSELMTVMTSGMAHISGGIMAAYILFGVRAEHLLTAVIMTAPGTLMMAKMFVPETESPATLGTVKLEVERTDVNIVDAAGRGTTEGLHLALNVAAMLLSFLALVALANGLLGWFGGLVHAYVPVVSWTFNAMAGVTLDKLSLQLILGWVFAPVAWAIGVPWHDAGTIGSLLGTRMVLNEFVAYSQLGHLKDVLDPRSFTDCDVRAVRVRELLVDRYSDRRHRRARADAPPRSGAARRARHDRRHARQLRDGDDCGGAAVGYGAAEAAPAAGSRADPSAGGRGFSPATRVIRRWTTYPRSRRRRAFSESGWESFPTWRSCSAPASAISPGVCEVRRACRTARFRTGRPRPWSDTRARWSPVRPRAGRCSRWPGACTSMKGTPMRTVTFGIRVLATLGVKVLVLTNAAGGINTTFTQGALMLITDHINLMGTNPLVGPNEERFGPRFPDMSEVYSARLRAIARDAARAAGVAVTEGVYVAVHGPSYETPAEIRAFRVLGADAVGMSTAPEAIVARHMGVEVLGISCITNMAAGVLQQPLVHDEVMETARRVRSQFIALLNGIVARL